MLRFWASFEFELESNTSRVGTDRGFFVSFRFRRKMCLWDVACGSTLDTQQRPPTAAAAARVLHKTILRETARVARLV